MGEHRSEAVIVGCTTPSKWDILNKMGNPPVLPGRQEQFDFYGGVPPNRGHDTICSKSLESVPCANDSQKPSAQMQTFALMLSCVGVQFVMQAGGVDEAWSLVVAMLRLPR